MSDTNDHERSLLGINSTIRYVREEDSLQIEEGEKGTGTRGNGCTPTRTAGKRGKSEVSSS